MKQTMEHVELEARKYFSRKEFKNKSTAEYSAALRFNKKKFGFMDQICSHMKRKGSQPLRKHTVQIMTATAKKYKRRIDFRKNDSNIYKSALKYDKKEKGFMDKICSHMKTYSEIREHSLSNIIKSAKKYKTKTEWRNSENGLYRAGLRQDKRDPGFIEKICSHMVSKIDLREKRYIGKLVIKLNLLFKNKGEFYIKEECQLTDKLRIDLIIKMKGKIIPVEVKHDDSEWSSQQINNQIKKYNNFFSKNNEIGVLLMSPNGKYGMSESDFIDKIIEILKI